MKVLIFGGTSEGRALAEAGLLAGDEIVVCVTTEYARALLPFGVRCLVRALDETEMERLFTAEAPDKIVDATHPFAACATKNIRAAAQNLGIPYERRRRPDSSPDGWREDVAWARDTIEAIGILKKTSGRILLTTGINTLPQYVEALGVCRLFARVLPSARSLAACEALHMPPGHVIAMQGPFTRDLNAAIYDMFKIRVLLSKDSGAAGGVPEKVIPALEKAMPVVMIERPKE